MTNFNSMIVIHKTKKLLKQIKLINYQLIDYNIKNLSKKDQQYKTELLELKRKHQEQLDQDL